MWGAAVLILAAAPSGSGVAALGGPEVLSVSDVIARHEELDGQKLRVRGWIGECGRLSCTLSAVPADAAQTVSLGLSPDFDNDPRFQDRSTIREVVAEATLARQCFNHAGEPRSPVPPPPPCTDRPDQLRSPKLLRIIRTLPSPAKRKP
jgi:hypothetical protein